LIQLITRASFTAAAAAAETMRGLAEGSASRYYATYPSARQTGIDKSSLPPPLLSPIHRQGAGRAARDARAKRERKA